MSLAEGRSGLASLAKYSSSGRLLKASFAVNLLGAQWLISAGGMDSKPQPLSGAFYIEVISTSS
jgi:hypothetical protein